jgi:transcriptional regulator with XRE-family HTH domain
MNFADNLDELLKTRGMTQAALDEASGVSTGRTSQYIKQGESPTLANAVKIADALDVSLDVLAGRDPRKYLYPNQRQKQLNDTLEMLSAEGQKKANVQLDLLSLRYKKDYQHGVVQETA